ncbi:cytochrome c peroxidase [Porifericola rhodea]|uniref:cytochrome-c peroxidase n=1 Tax=Porifericola rhodea TaxID=930972 RepID=UPI0026660636|nr:cytochrome c peroxidase [Porifericola rhodea]WKN31967.1 cytochrome c peroxidase [Porifericola rhodea]
MCSLLACEEGEGQGEAVYDPTPYELSLPWYFPDNIRLPEDNPLTEEGVALGRMLFYETQLSEDGSISCASCHQQNKAFTDGKQFPVGLNGGEVDKNAMSLHNLLWVSRFNWDGRDASLEEQAVGPLTNPLEMGLTDVNEAVLRLQATDNYPNKFFEAFGSDSITEQNLLKALAQFQRTLISDQTKLDRYWRDEYQPTELELKGMTLFYTHPEPSQGIRGANCGDCHLGPFTGGAYEGFSGFHNNGLDTDASLAEGLASHSGSNFDQGKFRAPSLRNIALTAPYMHDGRFSTLEEVLEHYDEHIQMSNTLDPLILEASNQAITTSDSVRLYLLPEEKEAVLAFLHMLTDSSFIQNEKFSNPFK